MPIRCVGTAELRVLAALVTWRRCFDPICAHLHGSGCLTQLYSAASCILLLQASAPAHQAPERQLLLFVCSSEECCTERHAFSAFRLQRRQVQCATSCPQQSATSCAAPPANAAQPAAGPVIASAAPASASDGNDAATQQSAPAPAFSAPAASGNSDALDFGDLLSALDGMSATADAQAAQQARTKHRSGDGRQESAAADNALRVAEQAVTSQVVQLQSQLPEFWIDAESEPHPEQRSASDMSDGEATHIQQLLQEYAQAEQAREGASASSVGSTAGGESYESSDAFDKFHKRLALQPAQCVRCAAGDVLRATLLSGMPVFHDAQLTCQSCHFRCPKHVCSAAALTWDFESLQLDRVSVFGKV